MRIIFVAVVLALLLFACTQNTKIITEDIGSDSLTVDNTMPDVGNQSITDDISLTEIPDIGSVV